VLLVTAFFFKSISDKSLDIRDSAHVGVDVDAQEIHGQNDAVVVATGATWPRDLKIPGRDANGIHFTTEFLQVRST